MKNPLNLATFVLGIALLIFGADYYQFPDWDVGISLIMGTLTYLTAPFFIHSVIYRNNLILATFLLWFTVDGSYVLYNSLLGHEYFRLENFYASICLYLLAGMIWYFLPKWREYA